MESVPPLRNEFNPEAPDPNELITISVRDATPPDGEGTSLEALILSLLPEAIQAGVEIFAPSEN